MRTPVTADIGRPPRLRRLRTAGATLAAVILLAVLAEAALAQRDAAAVSAPGAQVQVGDGRTLHAVVHHRDAPGPTIVLESGAGLPSFLWDDVVEALPTTHPVVAYDRAGTAWSSPHDRAGDMDEVVADLVDLLAAEGLPRPYVLVGHSVGGHYVRGLAAEHPDLVAGLVLVDPRHEHQTGHMPELRQVEAAMAHQLQWGARLRPLGIPRLVHRPSPHLPPPVATRLRAVELHPDHLRGSAQLLGGLDRLDQHVATHARDLGDLPITVLSARATPDPDATHDRLLDVLDELHEDMRSLSTATERHVLDQADHTSVLFAPHASTVAEHVTAIVTHHSPSPDRP